MPRRNPMRETAAPELDEAVVVGIMAGYLRYAIAQKSRFEAAGEEPPVTEDSDHNRFLWCRIRFPAFFRHVAREMDSPKYNDRIMGIATAAATSALKERPTLQDWTYAMGEERRHEKVARFQRRLAGEYAPDAVRIQDADGLADERMRVVATSFDPLAGFSLEDVVAVPEPDLEAWKRAPRAKFRSLEDWVTVSSALHAVYPEQLRIWKMVHEAIRAAAIALGSPPASRTVTMPAISNVVANHAASICADAWWIQRTPSVQQSLLCTPRVFEYSDHDARIAAKLWVELAQSSREWAHCGYFLLKHGALGLQRWGAGPQAGVLLSGASNMPGLAVMERAAMLSDAGYFLREAGRPVEAATQYRIAMPLIDSAQDAYHQVIVRVNLAEVLGGPARNEEAANLLGTALTIAGGDGTRLAGFWRNVATMFHRLGDEMREEAALAGLFPHLAFCEAATQRTATQRVLELQSKLGRVRPMDSYAAIRFG